MNKFEKLAMILVPIMGLAGLMYFFTWYVSDVKDGNFYDNQRIQGQQFRATDKTNTSQSPFTKITSQPIFNSKSHVSKPENKQRYKKQPINSQYRKAQPVNNFVDAETLYQRDLQRQKLQKEQYQKRLYANKIKIQSRKPNAKQCTYYLQQKERVRDRMRKKYTSRQFNELQKKQKYWGKKYADNCFSGSNYDYPR